MNRLDLYLTDKSLTKSRTSAKQHIKNGYVKVNGNIITKPSFLVDYDKDKIEINNDEKYVSRGAYKLLQAFSDFKINVNGLVAVDVGSSTGGFTQVLLEKKAKKVYAVDVGSNQLDDTLRNNERVISIENTDIRNIDKTVFIESIDFVTCDVSFISLEKTALSIYNLMNDGAKAVFLIKPQFEAGRANIGKNGVVKDKAVRLQCVENIINHLEEIGFTVIKTVQCDTVGKSGNVEYLCYIEKA
ncbi:MAG: TlyA family RNA methyltransferase [Clostridia bacterium]|nr:TlyA family RNA methyltransferase [Clostridia bacterium]